VKIRKRRKGGGSRRESRSAQRRMRSKVFLEKKMSRKIN